MDENRINKKCANYDNPDVKNCNDCHLHADACIVQEYKYLIGQEEYLPKNLDDCNNLGCINCIVNEDWLSGNICKIKNFL